MPTILQAVLSACLLVTSGCASAPLASTSDATHVVVVRHAEKGVDDARDPGLSTAGAARAESLAARLADRDVVAVYATAFRRTHDTALPTAISHGLPVQRYDASLPPADLADTLRRTHPRGTVLIVGHSNTVPRIVAALCGCAVAPIGEAAYDRWYEVRIAADGTGSLDEARY